MKKIGITGDSSGLGRIIKSKYAKSDNVLGFSRSQGYDLRNNEDLKRIIEIAKNLDILFLNAGLGKFSGTDEHSFSDIEDINSINLIANQKIISALMDELKNQKIKICVTLSTASFINGAFESVYNASKKALKEFIISVNTELMHSGSNNKIFMFVPHAIKGTKMNPGVFDNEYVDQMLDTLINMIEKGEDKYIPRYKEIYGSVFDEYANDPYGQGLKSIEYKINKNKIGGK